MRKHILKVNYLHALFLVAVLWLLLNFSAGIMTLKYGPTSLWDVVYSFSGIGQVYFLMEDSFPPELYSVPYYCISVPLFALLLWYWLRKPTIFKAFFLLAVGPIWGLFFTIHIVTAYFSFWWFCLFISVGLAWEIVSHIYQRKPVPGWLKFYFDA